MRSAERKFEFDGISQKLLFFCPIIKSLRSSKSRPKKRPGLLYICGESADIHHLLILISPIPIGAPRGADWQARADSFGPLRRFLADPTPIALRVPSAGLRGGGQRFAATWFDGGWRACGYLPVCIVLCIFPAPLPLSAKCVPESFWIPQ